MPVTPGARLEAKASVDTMARPRMFGFEPSVEEPVEGRSCTARPETRLTWPWFEVRAPALLTLGAARMM